jgi:hypothetical protein
MRSISSLLKNFDFVWPLPRLSTCVARQGNQAKAIAVLNAESRLMQVNVVVPHAMGRIEKTKRGRWVTLHKRILEWQAAHPNVTWVGWGIVWAIILVALFWTRAAQ